MCTEEEVMDIIWKLDVSKASGPHQTSVRMLKGKVQNIPQYLQDNLTRWLSMEKFLQFEDTKHSANPKRVRQYFTLQL